jgi:hypothetical protein
MYNLKTVIVAASIVATTLIWMLLLHLGPFCDDKYTMSSPCFDPVYRCQAECSFYDANFTGKFIENAVCGCDCGSFWVSACSGFAYNKTSETRVKNV